MIELIFVIVILGILAAVAIPKLAATRDDAKIASIKTDIGTLINAVPAWYQGQKEASILNAVSIDTNTWKRNTPGKADFTFKIDDHNCVNIRIVDINDTNTTNPTVTVMSEPSSSSDFSFEAIFQIRKDDNTSTASTDSVCNDLWTRISEQNITMAGKKVKW